MKFLRSLLWGLGNMAGDTRSGGGGYLLKWKSCLTLCDPMDYNLPGSSVHGILQARILEWVAISSSRGSSWPRDRTWVSCIAGGFPTAEPLRKVSLLKREGKENVHMLMKSSSSKWRLVLNIWSRKWRYDKFWRIYLWIMFRSLGSGYLTFVVINWKWN